MTGTSRADRFVVINGPEDGAEFPIIRAPFTIGAAPSCVVNIRLDETVRPVHAQVRVVSDGYGVRSCGGGVSVNGKRAGAFKSRVVRSGDILLVGGTSLMFECAPDGLARRSRGILVESDAAWAFRRAVGVFFRVVKWIVVLPFRLTGRVFANLFTLAALAVLLYFVAPGLAHWLRGFFTRILSEFPPH